MNKMSKVRVPSNLFSTGILSSCITLVLSVTYIVLSLVALVERSNCNLGSLDDIPGSGYFLNVLFRLYIQDEDCPNSMKWDGVAETDSVFLLIVLTLVASILTMITSIAFITVLCYEEALKYLELVAYVHVLVSVSSLVVDITFGTHFGIIYSNLNSELNMNSPGLGMNYVTDMARLAALALMTVSLKGFAAHIVNIVLLTLIAVHLTEYQRLKQKEDHSIHKVGVLNAFEHRRRDDDGWQPQPEIFLGLARGPHVNPAYLIDDESATRSTTRDQPASDYSRRLYDRSESWQAGPTHGARPFSYLEETKHSNQTKPPVTLAEPQWNRNQDNLWNRTQDNQLNRNQDNQWNRNQDNQWNRNQGNQRSRNQGNSAPPPMPAPDYSPPNARRLKSALKQAYI